MTCIVLYVVGDIHGCANLLLKLRQKISADAAKRSGPKKLVFLGDYVDRGPHSADVIDVLMNGPPEGIDEQVCLRGNYEQMMLDWHGQRDWLGSWLLNGGEQTCRSYGKDKARLGRHLKWLDGLPCLHQDGGHVLGHAGIGFHWKHSVNSTMPFGRNGVSDQEGYNLPPSFTAMTVFGEKIVSNENLNAHGEAAIYD
jgi:hypothetical protein